MRNDHGKPQAMLDDLFGVKQPLAPPALQPASLKFEDGEVPVASGGAEVTLAGGTALGKVGDTPAFIVNKVGKGQAIFLNCCFSNYAEVWAGGAGGETLDETEAPATVTAPIRAFVWRLLDKAGIKPQVFVSADKDEDTQIELARFTLGRGRLLGVLRSITSGAIDRDDLLAYTLTLPAPAHVYEARSGKYFGKVDKIADRVPRGIARVYAVLPYKVDKVTLSGGGTAAQGSVLRLGLAVAAASSAKAETHVLHLTVAGPDGKERSWYAQNLVAPDGKATAELPLALNDTPGQWTITARDVATGVTGTVKLTVKERVGK